MELVSGTIEVSCEALVQRIRVGDRAAEALLVERTRDGLVRLLARRLNDRALAEDLCHETYAIVLPRLRADGLSDPAAVGGFLASTARNLAIDHHRKRARRRTDNNLDDIGEPAGPEADDPAAHAHREQLSRVVRRLVDELPTERDRELLIRFYLNDESKERLCEALGVSDFHFNRIIHRARQRFAKLLETRVDGDPLLELACALLCVLLIQAERTLQ